VALSAVRAPATPRLSLSCIAIGVLRSPRSGDRAYRAVELEASAIVFLVRAPSPAPHRSRTPGLFWTDHYAGRCGGLLHLHFRGKSPACGSCRTPGGPQPPKTLCSSSHSGERPHTLALAMRDMLDKQRALSSHRLVRAIPAGTGRFETTRCVRSSRLPLPTALPNSATI